MKVIFAILITGIIALSGGWHPVKIDAQVAAPVFSDLEWSYPWYVQKADTGFINLVDTVITEVDTVHIRHNADCAIILEADTIITFKVERDTLIAGIDSLPPRRDTIMVDVDSVITQMLDSTNLPFTRASSHEDSLSIIVYGKGKSYLEEVQITVIGRLCNVQYNKYQSDFKGHYAKSSEHHFKDISLTLNKRNPATGDLLIGAFNFEGKLEEGTDIRLKIAGRFAVVVE